VKKGVQDFVLNFFGYPPAIVPQFDRITCVFLQQRLYGQIWAEVPPGFPTSDLQLHLSRIASKAFVTTDSRSPERKSSLNQVYLSDSWIELQSVNVPRWLGALRLAMPWKEIDNSLISDWKLWARACFPEARLCWSMEVYNATATATHAPWTFVNALDICRIGDEPSLVADAFPNFPIPPNTSSISSLLRSERSLFPKLSGFLISWQLPAVSWPSEATLFPAGSIRWGALSSSKCDFQSITLFLIQACLFLKLFPNQ